MHISVRNVRMVLFGVLFLLTLSLSAPVVLAVESEPLWLVSPVISPAGDQVAFSYRGVLYIVPTQGGEARALTPSSYYSANPVFSPDGKWVAFACDRYSNMDVFRVKTEGGQPERLSFHSKREIPLAYTPNGDSIVVKTHYEPSLTSGAFYSWFNSPFYTIPTDGSGEARMMFPKSGENLSFNSQGFIFEDIKGNEDSYRKHHTSSISRDLWYYNRSSGKLQHVISRPGEDRNPCFASNGDTFYFLSERDKGSFNVYQSSLSAPSQVKQVTQFEKNPVRNLSIAQDGTLCFAFEGRIYTMKEGGEPKALSIQIHTPDVEYDLIPKTYRHGASSAVLSPDGEEVAYIVRGDVFVTHVKHGITKRITNTPEMERVVDFGADGRTLVYDAERDGSWNLYITKIKRKEEKNFSISTELVEEPLLVSDKQTFQPLFSPDGKEVAFLQDRTKLMVINVQSKAVRQITDGSKNYSYADGDLSYAWSPDGKWLTLDYNAKNRWPNSDIGIVSAKGGSDTIFNVTQSGYTESMPSFAMGGDMIIWFSDRRGLRAHASWGSQHDVYAFFTNQAAYDKFMLSEFERDLLPDDEEEQDDDKDKKKKKKDKDKKEDKEATKAVKIEFSRPQDRFVRLTNVSQNLYSAIVTPDGKSMYYISDVEGDCTLWKMDLLEKEASKVATLPMPYASISLAGKGKYALISGGGTLMRLDLGSDSRETISYAAKVELEPAKEREYMYDHVCRQVRDKFYRTDLHGVDWAYYTKHYRQYLPHINNNYDFATLLSELLGELNASHTGSGYMGNTHDVYSSTSSLGILFDRNFKGEGVRVTEVLPQGPFDKAASKLNKGATITHIDGKPVKNHAQLPLLLNNRNGERIRIDYTSASGAKESEVVKPISPGAFRELLYPRWVQQRRDEVERLSKGRLGYVHIASMSTSSFHALYEELFGRYNDKEGVIIDTRYNGGGHMHEDIEVLLSGKKYLDIVPREHMVSEHPRKRWKKPTVMLISEANYSNAHGTPWVYKTQKLGKLVGQPVPGTMTSVWWETLIDPSLYFGVPIVGYIDENGNYLENQQLEPDVYATLDYQLLENEGRDTQIEKAVEVLLQEVDAAAKTDKWATIDAKYQKKK